jgi:hypothetical protein
MAIITNLRKWRNGEVINARDYVYERDLIVALVNEHEEELEEMQAFLQVTGSTQGILERVQFNASSEQDMAALPVGTVFYNPDKRTLAYKCEYGHIHNINQELEEIGKNSETENITLPAGTVVTWAGALGANKLFVRADGSVKEKSRMVGVLSYPVARNEFGPVVVFAEIAIEDFRQIMESGSDAGLVDGTRLYLSYTAPGKYTTTPPARPYADIWVATIVSINTNSHKGRIFVYPQNQRVEGGIWIEVSDNQPVGQSDGDFWYDIV